MYKALKTALIVLAMVGAASGTAFALNGLVDTDHPDVVYIHSSIGSCTGKARNRIVTTAGHCLFNHGALAKNVRVWALSPYRELPVQRGQWDVPFEFKRVEPPGTAAWEKARKEKRAMTLEEWRKFALMNHVDSGAIILMRPIQNPRPWSFLFERPEFKDTITAVKQLKKDEPVPAELFTQEAVAFKAFLKDEAHRAAIVVGAGPRICDQDLVTKIKMNCVEERPPVRRRADFKVLEDYVRANEFLQGVGMQQVEKEPKRIQNGDSGSGAMIKDGDADILIGITSQSSKTTAYIAAVTHPATVRFFLQMLALAR